MKRRDAIIEFLKEEGTNPLVWVPAFFACIFFAAATIWIFDKLFWSGA